MHLEIFELDLSLALFTVHNAPCGISFASLDS